MHGHFFHRLRRKGVETRGSRGLVGAPGRVTSRTRSLRASKPLRRGTTPGSGALSAAGPSQGTPSAERGLGLTRLRRRPRHSLRRSSSPKRPSIGAAKLGGRNAAPPSGRPRPALSGPRRRARVRQGRRSAAPRRPRRRFRAWPPAGLRSGSRVLISIFHSGGGKLVLRNLTRFDERATSGKGPQLP